MHLQFLDLVAVFFHVAAVCLAALHVPRLQTVGRHRDAILIIAIALCSVVFLVMWTSWRANPASDMVPAYIRALSSISRAGFGFCLCACIVTIERGRRGR